MDTSDSIKIIEQMFNESKQSLVKNSFHFILWSSLLIPCGIVEWYFVDWPNRFLVYGIAGVLGGVIAGIYGFQQSKKERVQTLATRVSGYVWGGFGLCLVFSIFYSFQLHVSPHTLILLVAGAATFATGGLSKFKPFIFGGLFLIGTAIFCGFLVEPAQQGLVYSIGLAGGYLIPGLMLRKLENA